MGSSDSPRRAIDRAEPLKAHIRNTAGLDAPVAFVDGGNTEAIHNRAARARSGLASPRWSPVDLQEIHSMISAASPLEKPINRLGNPSRVWITTFIDQRGATKAAFVVTELATETAFGIGHPDCGFQLVHCQGRQHDLDAAIRPIHSRQHDGGARVCLPKIAAGQRQSGDTKIYRRRDRSGLPEGADVSWRTGECRTQDCK